MEYLEMRGAVKLKANADKSIVYSVLDKLRETEFVDGGYIDIGIKERILNISAEGTIAESYSIRVLLAQLQDQLTETSMIGVSSIRWETLVVLKHWQPTLAMRQEVTDQMVFAN